MRPGPLDGSPGKVGEFQFHENLGDRSRRFFLGQVRHQFLEQLRKLLLALGQRLQVGGKRLFVAKGFSLSVGLDRPVVDAAAKIVKLEAELPEMLLQGKAATTAAYRRRWRCRASPIFCPVTSPMPQSLRTGSVFMNAGTSSNFTSNCPFGFFRSLAILAINLLGPIPADAVSFVLRKIRPRITCASGAGAPGWSRHVEVGFVERERLHQRREAEQDLPDDRGLLSVNVEARRKNDQVRATLHRHECRHGRANAELPRFVVAGRQHAAPIARPADARPACLSTTADHEPRSRRRKQSMSRWMIARDFLSEAHEQYFASRSGSLQLPSEEFGRCKPPLLEKQPAPTSVIFMKFTYYGHACFAVQAGGKTLLFDPFISPNPLAKKIDVNKVAADFILVSHGHGDHVADVVDIANRTGAKYRRTVRSGKLVRSERGEECPIDEPRRRGANGFRPRETHQRDPQQLDAGRFLWRESLRLRRRKSSDGNFYYAGDTALTYDMKLVGELTKLRFAVFPIGDFFTMGIDDAIRAAEFRRRQQICRRSLRHVSADQARPRRRHGRQRERPAWN